MKCIKCGAEIPEKAKFCPLCGQNNSDIPNFCMHCGSTVAMDAQFCENCGKPIEKVSREEEEPELEMPDISLGDAAENVTEVVEKLQDKLQTQTHGEQMHSAYSARTTAQTEASSRTEALSGIPTSARGEKPVYAPASVRSAASAQTQMPTQQATVTPNVTPNVSAAPAVSTAAKVGTQLGAQAVKTAGEAAVKTVGEAAVKTAGEVAAKSVSGAAKVARTTAICAAVVAFVIGAVAACLNFFVPAPEETVTKLIESVEELNYEDMLSCFDSKTEKQIRAAMGLTGDLFGSLTGISMDLEDMMAFAPSLAPYMETPDLGIASAETVLYADCSKAKLLQYCETANSGGSIPTGYLSDNSIVSFLMEYNISLPGLENFIAEVAIVKITLTSGEIGYLPMINEGGGDWRIPMMDLVGSLEGEY